MIGTRNVPEKKIQGVVKALNVAAMRDEGWDRSMQQFGGLFHTATVTWERFDLHTGRNRTHGYSGLSQATIEEYFAHYFAISPRVARATEMAVGTVVTDDQIIRPSRRSSDPYIAWLRKRTENEFCMFVKLRHNRRYLTALGVHRNKGNAEFSQHERNLLLGLTPYLQLIEATADEIRRLRGSKAVTSTLFEHMHSAIAYIDRFGRVTEMNSAMENLVAGCDYLALTPHRTLRVWGREGENRLQCAVRAAIGGQVQAIALRGKTGGAKILRLVPLASDNPARFGTDDVIIVIVQEYRAGSQAKRLVSRALELSDREAEIALLVAAGESIAAIAEQLDVTASTVRVHLRNIFEKTRVHRQAELATLIMKIAYHA